MFSTDPLRSAKGFDRVEVGDGCYDLLPGSGRQLAAALEDGIFRGVWVTSIYGAPTFLVLSNIVGIIEWTPEAMHACDMNDIFTQSEGEPE